MCSVPVGPFCCLYSGRVCIYVLYMCVCVCFFHLCKCLCSNHGSGCVSWRRRKASFEVGPVKWAPGSCAWSWPAKITEKEIIIYTEVNVFDLFTRIYLVWQTNYCDLANNSYNTTKLCIFGKLESSLGAIYYQLQIWLTSDQIVFKYKLFRIVTTLIEPSPSDDLEEQARKHRGSKMPWPESCWNTCITVHSEASFTSDETKI